MKIAQSVMLGFATSGVVLGGGSPEHHPALKKTPVPRLAAAGPVGVDRHRELLVKRKLATFVACCAIAIGMLAVVVVIAAALVAPAIVIVTSAH